MGPKASLSASFPPKPRKTSKPTGSPCWTTWRGRPASKSTPFSPPTTPASSKACALARGRRPGWATNPQWRPWTAATAREAVDRANGEVFAQMVNADGTQGYYSHLIVHKDSPCNTLDDVLKNARSLSFGNGDPNSTSGYLVPGYYAFALNKFDPKTHFKIVRSANHETNALAVVNKQVDVATNNSENLEKIKERYPEKYKDIKVIWTSPLIALDPLVMHKGLAPATKAKIKDFFYNYAKTDAREKEIVRKLSKLSGFKPSSNAQLTPIRQLTLFGKRNKIEADTTLTEADKKTRLAEIDQQLAALQLNTLPRHFRHPQVPPCPLPRTPWRWPRPPSPGTAWAGTCAGACCWCCWPRPGKAPTCARWICWATRATWCATRPSSFRPISHSGSCTCKRCWSRCKSRCGARPWRCSRPCRWPCWHRRPSCPGGSTSRCAGFWTGFARSTKWCLRCCSWWPWAWGLLPGCWRCGYIPRERWRNCFPRPSRPRTRNRSKAYAPPERARCTKSSTA